MCSHVVLIDYGFIKARNHAVLTQFSAKTLVINFNKLNLHVNQLLSFLVTRKVIQLLKVYSKSTRRSLIC